MVSLAILAGTLSCRKDHDPLPELPFVERTVIIYMAANNNLVTDAYDNLNQMEAGYRNIDGKLIVYARLSNTEPALYEISYDDSPFVNSRRVKIYPPHNSSDPTVMKSVFEDVMALYPARSYGAVLWSHATSWLPPDTKYLRLRSFGDDAGQVMDVKDLPAALPDDLDYLIFDACSMASLEVLYELKNKASYIVASPTEVVAVGMPYERLVSDLFRSDTEAGLQAVAEQFYRYYLAQEGIHQSASVSLIRTAYLNELATRTKVLLKTEPADDTGFRQGELQRLDFLEGSPAAYDFMDFLSKNWGREAVAPILETVDNMIPYKAHTPFFNNDPILIFSGISCYLPESSDDAVLPYYRTLKWYDAAGVENLF